MLTYTTVGVLELASKYKYGVTSRGAPLYLFHPYDENLPDFIVGSSARDTTRNQIALVEVPVTPTVEPGQSKPRGFLVELIGPVGEIAAETRGLLWHHFPTRQRREFSLPTVDTSDDERRQEISAAMGWTVFHVDPQGCRDVDDAIAWHPEKRLWAITIADVAALVPVGCDVDIVARTMGETAYNLKGGVVSPMLPPALSEKAGSLLPGERRRGVTLFIGPDGQESWSLTWIDVAHTFTYDNFAASPTAKECELTDKDPHDWIADLMITYNRAAAELLRTHSDKGGILRVQSAPEAEAVRAWSSISPELARLAHEAATYVAAAEPGEHCHAGLNLPAYCHASSPLRRYADLHNQRVIKAILRGGTASSACNPADLNRRTQAGRRWTRDLTFLHEVTPGRVHVIDVLWVDPTRVWVSAWKRLLRIRHDPADIPPPGTHAQIEIFCDPTRWNWQRRILTAPHVSSRPSTPDGAAS